MKLPPLLLLACLAACFLASCSKPAAPVASASPSDHRRLAPEGTLYLVQRASVTTDSGVIGFAPGTRVKFVEDRGEKLLVTDGTTKFEVRGDIVTNDLDMAAIAARSDALSQQELAKYLARQQQVDRQFQNEQNKLFDEQQREAAARREAAAIAAHGTNKLDRGAYHEKEAYYYRHYPWIYYPTRP